MCHTCPRNNITILPLINILIIDVVSARSYIGDPDDFMTDDSPASPSSSRCHSSNAEVAAFLAYRPRSLVRTGTGPVHYQGYLRTENDVRLYR